MIGLKSYLKLSLFLSGRSLSKKEARREEAWAEEFRNALGEASLEKAWSMLAARMWGRPEKLAMIFEDIEPLIEPNEAALRLIEAVATRDQKTGLRLLATHRIEELISPGTAASCLVAAMRGAMGKLAEGLVLAARDDRSLMVGMGRQAEREGMQCVESGRGSASHGAPESPKETPLACAINKKFGAVASALILAGVDFATPEGRRFQAQTKAAEREIEEAGAENFAVFKYLEFAIHENQEGPALKIIERMGRRGEGKLGVALGKPEIMHSALSMGMDQVAMELIREGFDIEGSIEKKEFEPRLLQNLSELLFFHANEDERLAKAKGSARAALPIEATAERLALRARQARDKLAEAKTRQAKTPPSLSAGRGKAGPGGR